MVVPVYNKKPHISRSISSIINQTYCNYELIIVNDASTDGSVEEIYKISDPRIRLIHRDKPGPGGYAARNLGIREAKADWVAFLDADDEWFPNHLEKYMELLNVFPDAKVLGCGWKNNYSKTGRQECFDDPYYNNNVYLGKHYLIFKDYLQSEIKGLRPLCTSVVCIDKGILFDAGCFPDGKCNRGGDVDTWLRVIYKSAGLAWSDHLGAIYHRDSTNMVTKTNLSTADAERQTIKTILNRCDDNELTKLLKRFANRRTINAWKTNKKLSFSKNIRLLDNIYFGHLSFKDILIIILACLPEGIVSRSKRFIRK